MMKLMSALTERLSGRGTSWPVLNGFSEGRSLRLPPGELIADEGVLLHDAGSGRYAQPSCDEAWIALRLEEQLGWYAVWCPYATRWEVLSFELEKSAVPYARRIMARGPLSRSA